MIHVSRREMNKAFREHNGLWKSAKQSGEISFTHKMVLFYAVECGLKALYMKRNRMADSKATDSQGENITKYKHDLKTLMDRMNMKSVKIPKTYLEVKSYDDKHQWEPKSLHEAWRYGRTFVLEKEEECVESLCSILEELNRELL